MFILRKITGEGNELNFALGDQYSVILKDQNHKEFMRTIELSGYSAFKDDLYGFVVYGNSEILMLFKNQRNYIMTETGKTFKNITDLALERSNKEYVSEMDKRREKVLTETISHSTVHELNNYGFVKIESYPKSIFPVSIGIEDDRSRDVVIDMNGNRVHFQIGFANYDEYGENPHWVFYDSDTSMLTDDMKWYDILPLASKDKK